MSTPVLLDASLAAFRRRLAFWFVARGTAICAASALAGSALLLGIGIGLEVVPARWGLLSASLYAALSLLAVGALLWPVLRLSRRRAARVLEARTPELGGRVQTYLDRSGIGEPENPLLPLLAEDARGILERHPPQRTLPTAQILGVFGLALAGLGAVAWLGLSGPSRWQPAAKRLWTFGIGAPEPRWIAASISSTTLSLSIWASASWAKPINSVMIWSERLTSSRIIWSCRSMGELSDSRRERCRL